VPIGSRPGRDWAEKYRAEDLQDVETVFDDAFGRDGSRKEQMNPDGAVPI